MVTAITVTSVVGSLGGKKQLIDVFLFFFLSYPVRLLPTVIISPVPLTAALAARLPPYQILILPLPHRHHPLVSHPAG